MSEAVPLSLQMPLDAKMEASDGSLMVSSARGEASDVLGLVYLC